MRIVIIKFSTDQIERKLVINRFWIEDAIGITISEADISKQVYQHCKERIHSLQNLKFMEDKDKETLELISKIYLDAAENVKVVLHNAPFFCESAVRSSVSGYVCDLSSAPANVQWLVENIDDLYEKYFEK